MTVGLSRNVDTPVLLSVDVVGGFVFKDDSFFAGTGGAFVAGPAECVHLTALHLQVGLLT